MPKDNRIGYEVQGKRDKYITLKDGKSVNNAQWHTVTYAFDGTHAEFYLDGASIGKFETTYLLKGDWTPIWLRLAESAERIRRRARNGVLRNDRRSNQCV